MKKQKPKRKIAVIVVISLLVFFIVLFAAIPPLIMGNIVNSHVEVETHSPADFGLEPESVILETEDNLNIAAWEVEFENPRAIVILLSGIENPSVTAFWGYAKMLQDNGYSSLLIEMRGHGASEGGISLGYKEYLDVKAAVEYITSSAEYVDLPIIIWGTSMGGVVAINSIGEIEEIDGVISASAYSSWPDAYYDNMIAMGIPAFVAAIEKPFVSLYSGFKLGFSNLSINPLNEIQKLNGRPALLMHSQGDSQVPFASFERITSKVKNDIGNNVEVFVREGDEHFICYDQYFSNPIEDTEFSATILGFLSEHY